MDRYEKLKLLAEYIAKYIEEHHRGFDFPSQKTLATYIEESFRWYETEHTDQEISILET